MTDITLISDSSSTSPPNADESYWTIDDWKWAFERFTGPGWTVTQAEFEHNDHNAAMATVLDIALRHPETGSHLTIDPFDPRDHHPGPTIYRSHRVRLRNQADSETVYLTLTDDAADELEDSVPIIGRLAAATEHPFRSPDRLVATKPRQAVHESDSRIAEHQTHHGRGYGVERVGGAMIAGMAGAHIVSQTVQQQTGLSAFV